MHASPRLAEELVEHGRALRRLAKDLVGRSDADDLVQDTAVRALRSPPAHATGLLAWLTTVMRNLAANRHRDDRRRARREVAQVPREHEPAAADTAARRDQVRAVTDALWALPEPYQGTLVQRYLQELLPAQIAARTGTPLATVKCRLQRGLDLLRAALARREGRDWRAALAPAFGLAAPPPCLWSSLSVASMTTFGKSVVVVAVCGALVLAWWQFGPLPPANRPVIAADGEVRPQMVVADLPPSPAPEQRVAVAPDVDPLASLAQPYEYELRARVVDADGMPFGGAHLALAPPGCALALSDQQTDDDGRLVVTWRARAPALTVAVGLAYQGSTSALQEVRMAAGTPSELHFVGGTAPLPAEVRVDALGRQIVTQPDCAHGQSDCRQCHAAMPEVHLFDVRGSLHKGLHPDAVFGDRLAVAPPAPGPHFVSTGWGHYGIAPSAGPSLRRTISGRVFGADGRPAPGVRVWARRNGFAFGVTTKLDGVFRIAWDRGVNGTVNLRAGGGPEGLAATSIEIDDDRDAYLDLVLATGRTLRGRALGADGAPQAGARVEFVSADGGDGDLATTGPDGSFAFANLPAGGARLLLWGVRGEKLPIAEERDVPGDGGEVVFDLRRRPPTHGELRLFVRGHDGEPAKEVEVRAWQQDTGRGAFLDRREDGAFHLHGLPAGFYRIEVGALANGFADLGPQWVDGQGLADLGIVSLKRPGRVHVDAATDPAGLELYMRRADVDVRADEIVPWTRDALLPPGRWVALWKRGDVVRVREFALTAGGESTLALDR